MEAFLHNKHYIQTDSAGGIVNGWSDGPLRNRPTADAVCINEQGGYQFRLYPDGEENPVLFTMDGIPLYRWDGTAVARKTEDDIAAELAALPVPVLPPSPNDRIAALEAALLAVMEGQYV